MSYRMGFALFLATCGFLLAILYGSTGSGHALLGGALCAFGAMCIAWNDGFKEGKQLYLYGEGEGF